MEGASILEAEIAELSRAIEEKRSALAAERGVVAEREVVHQVVSELIHPTSPATSTTTTSSPTTSTAGYLDTLDSDSIAKVNDLVASIPERGFKRAIAAAKEEIPYILDAFHDALVTHLYDELKNRGLIR